MEGGGRREEGGGWVLCMNILPHTIFSLKTKVCNVFRQLSSNRVGSLSALLYASGFCHTLALGYSRVHTPALSSPHTHTLLTNHILLFIVLYPAREMIMGFSMIFILS